ncbi:MAG: ATP-binding cassette domain-containing protein [Candidatus Omnitrophica bacterium]|nr:ATP-binding cassette domain-containing protein [Candidatus Omnitrophota bacterium]
MTPAVPMVDVERLSMRYGTTVALTDVSFQVRRGEIVGFLGPNGAGKSTVMKIVTTVIAPTDGAARVGGHDVQADPLAARRLIGYLPEQVPLYTEMQVDEYVAFAGRVRGMTGAALETRLAWVAQRCALRPVWKRPIGELSRGYRQRVGLAQALLHDPEVLILDEPTTGLDPLQIIEIRELLTSLAPTKAILFSTHILQEAEAIAHRIVIIHAGRIVAEGPLAALTQGFPSLEAAFIHRLKGPPA